MYFKDYAKKYSEAQEPKIEVILKDMSADEVEDKIVILELHFDEILSAIPLNEDGMYVALAYHYNIDWPWCELEPDYWIMDCLEESLQQLKKIENDFEDEETRIICKDFARIIEKAINNKKQILIRRL